MLLLHTDFDAAKHPIRAHKQPTICLRNLRCKKWVSLHEDVHTALSVNLLENPNKLACRRLPR